ncbi:hypothetical protein DPX16_5270 [Anabarilius grahami]|uniref:Uncharacterized protein n=1 Tax=Anabarilius grahami TaxID=495550 RepID=A0A3N0XZR1_ANAGA|nr:hypothetical protein DPX16_5270 [Anabarilius grahami]
MLYDDNSSLYEALTDSQMFKRRSSGVKKRFQALSSGQTHILETEAPGLRCSLFAAGLRSANVVSDTSRSSLQPLSLSIISSSSSPRAVCLLEFPGKDVLIITCKNMIPVYSTEKNPIAQPPIGLGFSVEWRTIEREKRPGPRHST